MYPAPFACISVAFVFAFKAAQVASSARLFTHGPHAVRSAIPLAGEIFSSVKCSSRSPVPQPTTCAWWSNHHRNELVLQLVLQSCVRGST